MGTNSLRTENPCAGASIRPTLPRKSINYTVKRVTASSLRTTIGQHFIPLYATPGANPPLHTVLPLQVYQGLCLSAF